MLFLFALFYSSRHHPRPVMTESNFDEQTLIDHSSVIVDYTIRIYDQHEQRIKEELKKIGMPINDAIEDYFRWAKYSLGASEKYRHVKVHGSVFTLKTMELRIVSKDILELHIVVRSGPKFW